MPHLDDYDVYKLNVSVELDDLLIHIRAIKYKIRLSALNGKKHLMPFIIMRDICHVYTIYLSSHSPSKGVGKIFEDFV